MVGFVEEGAWLLVAVNEATVDVAMWEGKVAFCTSSVSISLCSVSLVRDVDVLPVAVFPVAIRACVA